MDWVLDFCTYGQALLVRKPDIGGDLLTFVGIVARLARDHPDPAWAAYEQMFRARAVANPSTEWNKLDQEVWVLSAVKPSGPSTQLPQKRCVDRSCIKWNEGTFCPFKACKFIIHAATVAALSTVRWPAPLSLLHQRKTDI